MKHRIAVALFAATAIGLLASSAGAVNLDWVSKTCVVIDSTFHVCKPSESWDTQKKSIVNEPVRWVLHRSGYNPLIKLIYDSSVTGQTAHDYAKQVKKDLELRGIRVSKVDNRVVNGRNVSLIHGTSSDRDEEFLVAVYRDRDKGLRLECAADTKNFSLMSQEFMAAINSVRFQ